MVQPELCVKQIHSVVVAAAAQTKQAASQRDTLRLAIPSKGRMAEDTQQLLKVRLYWLSLLCVSRKLTVFTTAGLPIVCVQAKS